MLPPAITNCTPRVQELVGWYLGTPSTAFMSATIRSLVLTATARMPYLSLSHQASTSSRSQSSRVSGQVKYSPSSERIPLVLVVVEGRFAELVDPFRKPFPRHGDGRVLVAAVFLADADVQRVVPGWEQRAEHVVPHVLQVLGVEEVRVPLRLVHVEADRDLAERVGFDELLGVVRRDT